MNAGKYLLSITLIGLILRYYALGDIPASLSGDEAAYGYNAYSIVKTGKDEFNRKFPLIFQSFDDHKQPVYFYLTAISVWLFGLSEWSIRLPSAILGTLLIPLIYLLSMQLSQKRKISLLTSLFTAITPWFIQYSRIALEMMAGMYFCVFALWVYLIKGHNLRRVMIWALSLALGFWSYYSYKLWIGVFLSGLLLVRRRPIYIISGVLVFIVLVIPYLWLSYTNGILQRPYAISVFVDQKSYDSQLKLLENDSRSIIGKIIHNRRWVSAGQAIDGYLRLNPAIVFAKNPFNHAPNTGLLYIFMLPLIFIGIFELAKNLRLLFFIIIWIGIGLVPAALSIFPPFDRRMLIVSFPLVFTGVYGLVYLYKNIKNNHYKKIYLSIGAIILFFSLFLYQHDYFAHAKDHQIEMVTQNMKEIVMEAERSKADYKNVYISLKFDQPLLYFLFYTKYAPQKYLEKGGTISGGYLDERNGYENYRFKFIKTEDLNNDSLYIFRQDEIQPCINVFKKIQYTKTQQALFGRYDNELPNC